MLRSCLDEFDCAGFVRGLWVGFLIFLRHYPSILTRKNRKERTEGRRRSQINASKQLLRRALYVWLSGLIWIAPSWALIPFKLTPYTAVYSLDLSGAEDPSTVEEGAGEMTQSLQEVPGGWTFRQEGQLSFSSTPSDTCGQETEEKEGKGDSKTDDDPEESSAPQTMRWVYTLWEAKNGRHFRFIWQRWIGDFMDEDIQGEVLYDPQTSTGKVTYARPDSQAQALHGDILFPLAYMQKILDKMKEEDPGVVSEIMFSGNGMAGPQRVNTFVASPHVAPYSPLTPPPSNREHLREDFKMWPTFAAAFHPLSLADDGGGVKPEEGYTVYTSTGLPLAMNFHLGGLKIRSILRPPSPSPCQPFHQQSAQKAAGQPKEASGGAEPKEATP